MHVLRKRLVSAGERSYTKSTPFCLASRKIFGFQQFIEVEQMYMPTEPLANSTDENNRRRHEDDFHLTYQYPSGDYNE